MAFEDLLDHRCDIYHMVKGEKDMGFAIKQTGFSYPKVPDVEDVACHFNVNANAEDLGAEAIRKIEVKDFPVIVVIDREGNNLYETAIQQYHTLEEM